MFKIAACLVGIFALLLLSEQLNIKGRGKGELKRKFTHVTVGLFVASWPWIISFNWIAAIGLAMVGVVYINRHYDIFKFNKNLTRESRGDYWFALGIALSAMLTTSKIFFCMAILNLALADGLAAVAGRKYGRNWAYEIMGQKKTVIGSMTFWFFSVFIFGFGGLAAVKEISFATYVTSLLIGPALLTVLENISPNGQDNVVVPLATILVLSFL